MIPNLWLFVIDHDRKAMKEVGRVICIWVNWLPYLISRWPLFINYENNNDISRILDKLDSILVSNFIFHDNDKESISINKNNVPGRHI